MTRNIAAMRHTKHVDKRYKNVKNTQKMVLSTVLIKSAENSNDIPKNNLGG